MSIPGQATTGFAILGRGIARRIRVHVKPPNDGARDSKKHRKSSLRTNLSHLFLPTMQDPERVVGGSEPDAGGFDDTGDSYETSAPLTAPTAPPAASGLDDATKKAVDNVLYSDIGVNTLLNRLKQSLASLRTFSTFLKKRSNVEDEHAKELRKLSRATSSDIRSPDSRQDSYSRQFEAVNSLHERMAENGLQFALNLHQMHEDLNQLAFDMERGRKHWKQTGLSAEKKVSDAEAQLEKARQKYESLAEDLDALKTGDKSGGRHFGLRGPKTAEQREEDLQKRLQMADQDYQAKVQYAQQERQQLLSTYRPQAVKAIQDLVKECDSGLSLQMQKFATFNERLLLGNGLLISPLNDASSPAQKSMRELVSEIDNDSDFSSYVRSFSGKIPGRGVDLEYKKHPTLVRSQPQPVAVQQPYRQPEPAPKPMPAPPVSDYSGPYDTSPRQPQLPAQPPSQFPMQQYSAQPPPPQSYTASGPPVLPAPSFDSYAHENSASDHSMHQQAPSEGYGAPAVQHQQHSAPTASGAYGRAPYPNGNGGPPPPTGSVVPSGRPDTRVFGLSLDDLFDRDQSPVPLVVYQCIQAVDLFGLDHEGIYRVSGNSLQVQELKAQFDRNAFNVDFRNPETFYHDVNNPANLLKQFLRELPDPLLTSMHYSKFIEAARIPDDLLRRDSMHATINELPDPNYATLRALVLHLNRVDQHSEANRMTPTNLAVVFAPTLMGPHTGQMSEAGLQPKVIETILQNALQIFDDD
ncbi:hypothetical protein FKW77_010880 [Venturia effusa]|uniref:Rho-GAP domain-containing protein n=1 Tax=Venturia effusa TaxID=50376 RepID=A0A517KYQ5_9PEZI|nr:hypothetical protein FKW77_010880 [Venturia effusa]